MGWTAVRVTRNYVNSLHPRPGNIQLTHRSDELICELCCGSRQSLGISFPHQAISDTITGIVVRSAGIQRSSHFGLPGRSPFIRHGVSIVNE